MPSSQSGSRSITARGAWSTAWTCAVPAGTVYGFLGRNGAGKSTTIKMLLGMVQPNYGRVELLGHEIAALAARGAGPHRLSGGRASALRLDDGRRSRAVRRRVSCRPLESASCSTRFSTTSRFPRGRSFAGCRNGQRANVALALAIAPDPDLLILDDPTLGLDTVARRDFLMSMIHLVQRRGGRSSSARISWPTSSASPTGSASWSTACCASTARPNTSRKA